MLNTNLAVEQNRFRVSQGILSAVAFSLLLAGTNSITPLLPLYSADLGFDHIAISLTFVAYVGVLVVVLLALTRPSITRFAPLMLCSSLILSLLSDWLLSTTDEQMIIVGRGVAGVAGGLGTSSAAALVVSSLGAIGRSVSATGNILGAVVGTAFSQVCVEVFSQNAMHLVFVFHAIACGILVALLAPVLFLRRGVNKAALSHTVLLESPLKANKIPTAPLVTGCIAWIMLSCAIVSLPTLFDNVGMEAAKTLGIIFFLVFVAMGQLASPLLKRYAPWISGVPAMTVGTVLLLSGLFTHSSVLVVLGLCFMGLGAGITYRLGLIMIVRNASPAEQGALASKYAAITYGMAAAAVLAVGILSNHFQTSTVVPAVFVVLIMLKLAMSYHAPRLRDM